MSIASGETIRVAPHAVFRAEASETLVLDLAKNRFFQFDSLGARVWRLIDNGTTLEAIVAALVAEYEVEAERVGPDVEAFVEELVELGLARVGDAGC